MACGNFALSARDERTILSFTLNNVVVLQALLLNFGLNTACSWLLLLLLGLFALMSSNTVPDSATVTTPFKEMILLESKQPIGKKMDSAVRGTAALV